VSSVLSTAQGGTENAYGKVDILLQTYVSRGRVDDFSLISDTAYVVQNASRILRGVFEIALRKGWVTTTAKLLELSKTVERRQWCGSLRNGRANRITHAGC